MDAAALRIYGVPENRPSSPHLDAAWGILFVLAVMGVLSVTAVAFLEQVPHPDGIVPIETEREDD